MRIECEVCSATYTIDDAQLSDQPIGAQCPYCGHVRLVRRGDAQAGQSFSTATARDLGFSAPPPAYGTLPPVSGGAPPAVGGYGHTGTPAISPGLGGGPTALQPYGGAPFDGSTGLADAVATSQFPGGRGAPPSPIRRGGASSGLSPELDISRTTLGPTTEGGSQDRFAELDGFQTNVATGDEGAKCQVCGTALTDEFDKVIGLCDVHQRDRRGSEPVTASAGGDNQGRWYARTRDGRVSGPMGLEDLRARIRQGDFSTSDEFSKDGFTYTSMAKLQEIAYLAAIGVGGDVGIPGVTRPRSSFARSRIDGFGRAFTWGLAAVAVGVLCFLGVAERDKIEELFARMSSTARPAAPASPNPLKRQLASWRLAHPDVSGTAHEHLVTARARHLEDTWRGYQLAEDAFERALLLDENDATAIAGFVENLAVWRSNLSSPEEIRTAQAAIRYALDNSPENAAVHRAQAALALARGDLNACRSGADRALERDPTDGLAHLVLAGCYMEGNVQLAIQEAERAMQLVPELRRADRVLAVAYAKVGRYASALKLLDARIKAEPKNAALHVLYGNIARELALLDVAEQHYKIAIEAGGDIQEDHLALGELLIESGNLAGAVTEFKKASETRNGAPERLGKAYAGLARAELARGHIPEAARQAKLALLMMPRDPEALLIGGESALAAGSSTTAATLARRALEARTGEPSALVLAGRTAARERARDRAMKYYEEAIANDPNDVRLKGILAAMYLSVGGTQQAYALMRKAAEVDPSERLSRSRVGPLAIGETPVKEAIELFRKSASEEANASVANSSIGLMYYQLGDRAKAQESIARALKMDDSNVTALLYDAQLALDRGDVRRAEAAATRILTIERGAALGHLMLARAYARRGDKKGALVEFQNALRSNPGLLVAKVEAAGIELKTGDRERALQELGTAHQLNPHSLITRRLLYEADH